MKKRTIIVTGIGAAVLLAGGIAFGVNRYQYSKNVVDVVPVEMLNSDWGFDEEGNSGMVTNSMSQEIVPDEDQTVKKIYVKEGQKVKIGDKLLAYDMAKKKLELELKGYDVKEIEFSIQRAEKELSNLKKGIVSGSSGSDNSVGRRDPLLASLFLRSNDVNSSEEQDTAGGDKATENVDSSESTTASKPDEATTTEKPQATTADTEKPTTTEAPAATTEAPDDDKTANVYSALTSSSIAYKGEGTADSPYRYLCTSDCRIKGSFINMIRGYSADGSKKTGDSLVVILEVRQDNKPGGSLIKSLTLYGSQETKKNQKSSWTLDSYVSGKEDDDTDNTSSSNTGSNTPGSSGGDSSGGNLGGGSSGGDISYTKEEIKDMITEKENDLADLKLDLKEAQLEYDTMKKEIDDGTVTAVINGVVKEVNDPDDAASDGSAVVTISSEGNLYVKGAVDEFSYKSLKEGATVTASSWETGNDFQATVTEVSPYPTSGTYYSNGMGNPNVSYYPFTAIIEDPPEDISSGESVTIKFNKNQQIETEGSIYLPLAYVRTENNKSYVYLRGKDKKLTKRYVTTGQTLYNYVIEIKSGLKVSDSVAFPYGKTVKEGAKTKVADEDADIIY